MAIFKKDPKVENSVEPTADTPKIEDLMNLVNEMKESQNNLNEKIISLEKENKELVNANRQTEINNKINNYATKFSCESGSLSNEASVEEKLWNLLEAASNQVDSIKNQITGNPAGEAPEETPEVENNVPSNINEAFNQVQKETGLKGQELYNKVYENYPELFKIERGE